jgi:iron complex transport system permease protein
MAIVCGIGLAVSGVQMQGITRNPLVSPFTLGISSAAALGASVAIMVGVSTMAGGTFLVIGAAFACSMTCALTVFGLSKLKGTSPETLVLAGIALSYFFSAITSLVQFFASEEDLMAMVHWTFGSFTGVTWNEIGIVTVVIAVCVPLCMKFSWDLNAMSAGGDEAAKGLGVNTSRVRNVSLLLASFMTATIISFTGIIGFVCLVSPHIARYLVGGDHRFLIPASCIVGAILTVGADTFGRTILSPIILPISIVVSFVGVPMFLYLMLTRKQDYWRK